MAEVVIALAHQLRRATQAHDLALMASLLAQGVDPNFTDENGNSAMHHVAGNCLAFELLKQYGGKPWQPNLAGNTAHAMLCYVVHHQRFIAAWASPLFRQASLASLGHARSAKYAAA